MRKLSIALILISAISTFLIASNGHSGIWEDAGKLQQKKQSEIYPRCKISYTVQAKTGGWYDMTTGGCMPSMDYCRENAREIAMVNANRGQLIPNTVRVTDIRESGSRCSTYKTLR